MQQFIENCKDGNDLGPLEVIMHFGIQVFFGNYSFSLLLELMKLLIVKINMKHTALKIIQFRLLLLTL